MFSLISFQMKGTQMKFMRFECREYLKSLILCELVIEFDL